MFKSTVFASALALSLAVAGSAQAESWSFGVMSDTQWTTNSNGGQNPGTCAVGVINAVNQQFINQGVKFVVQVGDLVDKVSGSYTSATLDVRATAAQTLYNAGIGFFPLRGNHESSSSAATRFQQDFQQTQNGNMNATPAANFVSGIPGVGAQQGSPFTMGSNFSSPNAALNGLSYSFDYNNARFVILDSFVSGNTIANQTSWFQSTLASNDDNNHAFVFAHKGLIMMNHADGVFGSTPNSDTVTQNAYFQAMADNNVKYFINGHDHVHERSVIDSPDYATTGNQVTELTTASDSYKFYDPKYATESLDEYYSRTQGTPTRQTVLAQDRHDIGYYTFTVDGPRVTVNYFASETGVAPGDLVNATAEGSIKSDGTLVPWNFTLRESFGYSLNGKEFIVDEGESLTVVADSHDTTAARILAGINGSDTLPEATGRSISLAVDTGWAESETGLASDILHLWGMDKQISDGKEETDTFVLAMKANGAAGEKFLLATKDENGNWVNAVDLNYGGTKRFYLSAYSGQGLGSYGYDADTGEYWAVINHNSEFAVATPVPGAVWLLGSGLAGLLGLRRRV